ncbi:MAG: alpha-E domain-containing protein [Bryobacteraceae bacterium]
MSRRPLLSRVADSVYWVCRYMERAENVARFIDVNFRLVLDAPGSAAEQWQPLIDAGGDTAVFAERCGKATRENVLRFLAADPDNRNSILSCLRAARENARTVRDTISAEMWEQINLLHLSVVEQNVEQAMAESPLDFLRDVKRGCHLFRGVMDATMSHDEAWHFGRIGRLLERADKTTRLMDVKYFILLPRVEDVGTTLDDAQWSAVLKSATAFVMYRKRHGRINPVAVADFLLLDRFFPRSALYCLTDVDTSLHAISGTPPDSFQNQAERLTGKLRSELEYASARDILGGGMHEFLDDLQKGLNRIDEAIYTEFFARRPVVEPSRAMAQRQGA